MPDVAVCVWWPEHQDTLFSLQFVVTGSAGGGLHPPIVEDLRFDNGLFGSFKRMYLQRDAMA